MLDVNFSSLKRRVEDVKIKKKVEMARTKKDQIKWRLIFSFIIFYLVREYYSFVNAFYLFTQR